MNASVGSAQRRTAKGQSTTVTRKVIKIDPCDISGVGWANLEPKFFELMDLMEAPTSGISALEARAAHRQRVSAVVVSLLDRAQEESRRLLVEGDGPAAEEAGVKVLRLRELFYGQNSLELVPAYLHLARTKQFLERYGGAEDMLSLAHFIVLQHQDKVSTTMKAELHQTFGLLYAADGQLDAAVKHLTCTTYYLSYLHGPRHVLTTFSYFDLANVFVAQASMESAMALYDAVKDIWYTHLTAVLRDVLAEKAAARKLAKYKEDDDTVVDLGYASAREFGADNLADTSKMLYGILAIQKERFRVAHPTPARAAFVLGLFLLWIDDVEEARRHLNMARALARRFHGQRHPVVQEIEEWCVHFDVEIESTSDNEDDADEGEGGEEYEEHGDEEAHGERAEEVTSPPTPVQETTEDEPPSSAA